MRALISVSDKRGIVEFAKELNKRGVEIISTGGTAKTLEEAGVPVIGISDVTNFPECLGGRVKTLHPNIHGGILAIRDNREHLKDIEENSIEFIDMVVVNLYPFKETILKEGTTLQEAIENIDIGGPTMIRSAAKNHRDVLVVCDAEDYGKVIENFDSWDYEFRYNLAAKAFKHTANYDAMISRYLIGDERLMEGDTITLTFEKVQELRYGENSHQKAVFYKDVLDKGISIADSKQIQGKELSFNNINDSQGAISCLLEFKEPTAVVVKHANPCGVATDKDIKEAFLKAKACDPVSIFGGIVALNRKVEKDLAEELVQIFLEVIIAPSFSKEALEVLATKKNLRILEIEDLGKDMPPSLYDMKKVYGGLLLQTTDRELISEMKVVTDKAPTKEQEEDMIMAMKVVKHLRSNAIVIVKNGATIGLGPGQTNRIWALENALKQSLQSTEGAVIGSDAFFPFDDCVEMAGKAKIAAIIQPGGSLRDEDSIKKANELGIPMVFSGLRHFKH